jgi:hypothetical protein
MGCGALGAASIIKGLADGIDACGHRTLLPRGRVCGWGWGGGVLTGISREPRSDPNIKEVGTLGREVRSWVEAGARPSKWFRVG